MIDQAVYDRLKTLADGRVHFVRMPQKPVLPAVVYTVISSTEEYSDDGHDQLAEYRVQIDVWGTTRSQIVALMAEVKTAMRPSATDFDVTGENDGIDEIEDETNYHRASVDFMCWQKT